MIHRAAKKAFNELGLQKLPSVKSLQTEYASLLSEKKAVYVKLQEARNEMRELTIHRENLRQILGMDDRTAGKKKNMAEVETAMFFVVHISTAGAPPQNLFCDGRGLGMCPSKSHSAPVGAVMPSLPNRITPIEHG